ncbi:hypothetical protein Q8F55_004074 [Vanrija albida]|uniref:Ubiquitin-like domain-containing protein n=1 Tax=Vanrija albida TaxID=181172 RepID=A0ABR3Q6L0_9TREE
MGLGIFHRRRKFASVSAAPPTEPTANTNTMALRVLIDSGPAQRELFAIRVSADEPVEAIRSAIAQHTGISSMSLFKVSIPWQAYYEAGAYSERYGASAPLLSIFSGFNIDDASQLTAANGVRGRRRSVRCGKPCPSVRDWFPDGSDGEHIDVLARSASSSTLDWAKPSPATPLTFCVRFASIDGTYAMPSAPLTLVDIAPDATVQELKAAILLAAGRPAPSDLLDALVLWRVDMSEAELEDLDARGGLARGRQPQPKAGFPHPALLADEDEPVATYFPNYRSDVRGVSLSAWVHPAAAHELAPRLPDAPRFAFAEPAQPHPELPLTFPDPLPVPTPVALGTDVVDCAADAGDDVAPAFCDPFAAPRPVPSTCCPSHSDLDLTTGFGALGGAGGLIGLGISFAPMSCTSPSDSSHSSLEEEVPSWPPTPDCSGTDGWLPPASEFVAVRKQDWEVDADARTEIPSMPTPKLAPEASSSFFIPLQTATL